MDTCSSNFHTDKHSQSKVNEEISNKLHQYKCSNYKVITVTQYQPLNNDAELERTVPY